MRSGQPSVDFLTARQEQLLAEYESKLRERCSGLFQYPEPYEKCLAEAAEVIADLSGVLAAGDSARYQPPRMSGSYLRDLRPADLADAARTLFEVLVAAAAEEPSIPLLEFSLGASTVIFRRLSRDLSHHMLLAFDRIQREYMDERRRMARDLHDRIGGDIAAVHRNLDSCPVDDRSLTSAREVLRGVLDELRWVISGLRPARLPTGFAWALELCCHIECPASTQAEVSVTGDDRWLDAQTRYEIFLIIREAMRNAFNHSGASRVTVAIDSTESGLTATVTDNGIGFQPKAGQGVGLTLMMDRAEVLGGMVRLDSRPGAGTTVELVMPKRGTPG
jgi:signal transduction histidine kinase